jgi:glucoside 3-dehydrogenase (cytochrome c) hitch-hiker subunit
MTDNDIAILDTPEMITRREAVVRVTALLGGVALIGGSAWITGCRTEKTTTGAAFTNDDVAYLDEIADTILPTTSTPGAKAAKTGAFMALMVRDTYSDEDEKTFRDGMQKLNDASKAKNGGKSFMEATPAQRLALLEELDREQHDYSEKQRAEAKKKSDDFLTGQQTPSPQANTATQITAEPPNKYFGMMKQLALLGYFTSEIGVTQAQRYMEAPGRWDPCIPYDGKPSWAGHA